jgi:hypothetical protein
MRWMESETKGGTAWDAVHIAERRSSALRQSIASEKYRRRHVRAALGWTYPATSCADRREVTAMEDYTDDKWITRQELADRYGVPVKTPAEWASKGTGPRYAKFGRHVRYRLCDVIDWERKQFAQDKRDTA